MQNMILIDLETLDFSVERGGIYEVGAIAISNYEVIEKLHLGIVTDAEKVKLGYGQGYENLSHNEEMKLKFQSFIKKYNFPLVAHNAPFDRKFLTHFNWIDEDYNFYDSIRAIKTSFPGLESYSMSNLMNHIGINNTQTHTALDDTEVLLQILKTFKPDTWLKLGEKAKKKRTSYFPRTDFKKEFEVIDDIFKGQNIVFTGKGPFSRDELVQLVKKTGGISTSNSLTKKTNILVAGNDAGSKLNKALTLGIKVLPMEDFCKLVSHIDLD